MACSRFTAVVLAADRGADDPVARAAGVCCKSLTPIGDRAMVLHVVDALRAAREVRQIILCGPPRETIARDRELSTLVSSGEVRWIANRETPSTSTHHVLATLSDDLPVLVTTSDHALLNSHMVDHFCTEARRSGCDVVAGVAAHHEVQAAYPETKRTAIRLQDGAYCGCNLFAFLTGVGRRAASHWKTVEKKRKKPLHLVSSFGPLTLLRFALGKLTSQEALSRVSRKFGLRAGIVLLPFPEAAIDVDTPSDWQLVQRIVAGRS
ncbi:MAG: nucleotidyltransferase family protein [Deltaproteobacteria bacterium]|nr:nucleotidyltransferase family protein [Deltaproteobacteria bacterium]MBW2070255.1 nucleotidyltransferase family protein [Deltaproteobacteria bacterium]